MVTILNGSWHDFNSLCIDLANALKCVNLPRLTGGRLTNHAENAYTEAKRGFTAAIVKHSYRKLLSG